MEVQKLWMESKTALIEGIALFETAGDRANQVLLHCNLGRLMRLCAHTHAHISLKGEEQEIGVTERRYFDMVGTGLAYCAYHVLVQTNFRQYYFYFLPDQAQILLDHYFNVLVELCGEIST